MPELPEVEIYSRYLADHALGQPIARVVVRDERVLGGTRRRQLAQRLRGRSFEQVARHGKHLFARAGAEWVHFHFGMTGDLAYYRDPGDEPRFARVVFDFHNGAHLAIDDMRLFGAVELTPSPGAYISEHRLGHDPLDPAFRFADFCALLKGRRGAIKSLLMSQDVIAGIGNLYADEILYQASIRPRRPADLVKHEEAKVMYALIRRILRDAIRRRENGGQLPWRYLFVHREEGGQCPTCGGTIRRSIVFGRTTYSCGTHQR